MVPRELEVIINKHYSTRQETTNVLVYYTDATFYVGPLDESKFKRNLNRYAVLLPPTKRMNDGAALIILEFVDRL